MNDTHIEEGDSLDAQNDSMSTDTDTDAALLMLPCPLLPSIFYYLSLFKNGGVVHIYHAYH